MSNEQKLTPWFINGEKPARPGVYNVSCRKHKQSGRWYARWDGVSWFRAFTGVSTAGREVHATVIPNHWHAVGSWRGLAEKPE